MFPLLYSLSVYLYIAAIRLAAPWNAKARLWVNGRKQWRIALQDIAKRAGGRKTVLVHCASLGEFEQGRPVIEAIRHDHPNTFIVLSFFSPSGYEIRKAYDKADAIIYLPADTPANARDFVGILEPELAIFVKYEYWLNLLKEMENKQVPVLMISAIFRPGQVFFRWYGSPWKKILPTIDRFFLQDEKSASLLREIGITDHTVSGDTRFDRVIGIAEQFKEIDQVREFCAGCKVLVAGSTWKEDEVLISQYAHLHSGIKMIIAPHEIHEEHIQQIEKLFPDSVRFSKMGSDGANGKQVLIIDNIGMLSRLYHYADICFIGGGFGKGIHNILEAAVHGKPVLFGPNFEKFNEAKELIAEGGAFTIARQDEMNSRLDALFHDDVYRKISGDAAYHYVRSKAGATKKILAFIQENRLLTS